MPITPIGTCMASRRKISRPKPAYASLSQVGRTLALVPTCPPRQMLLGLGGEGGLQGTEAKRTEGNKAQGTWEKGRHPLTTVGTKNDPARVTVCPGRCRQPTKRIRLCVSFLAPSLPQLSQF